MLKDRLRVNQVAEELGVSKTVVYRRLKRFKHLLKGKLVKEKGVTFITIEGLQVLKGVVETESSKVNKEKALNTDETPVESEFKVLKEVLKHQVDQLEKQLSRKDQELDKRDETINKLIDRQADSEEKLQTIIMKMTNDLEKVRSENRLLLEESKKKAEPEKKSEPKKTDRVISIQEFIAAKIEEDIERSNYEVEKKRLKQQYDNPLQGRSALYKIYVKMFRPDMLRKYV